MWTYKGRCRLGKDLVAAGPRDTGRMLTLDSGPPASPPSSGVRRRLTRLVSAPPHPVATVGHCAECDATYRTIGAHKGPKSSVHANAVFHLMTDHLRLFWWQLDANIRVYRSRMFETVLSSILRWSREIPRSCCVCCCPSGLGCRPFCE